MIPYVIDRQKRNNYITLFFIFTIASFALGYYLGFQTAVIQSSPASVSVSSTKAETEAENSVAQEDKELPVVEQDKASASKSDTSVVKTVETKKTTPVQKKPEAKVAKSSVSAQPVSSTSSTQAVKSSATAQSSSVQPTASTNPVNTNPAPQSLTGTYSVQAGLFGSRRNALKYIDKLKASGFDAYLNEYLASDGIMRYNVRFGYFPDRKTGESRLAEFKTQFTTPAYLVINK